MHSNVKLFIILAITALASIVAKNALSQQIQYKLVDTGVLTHNVHGKGIEMRIQPSALPEGGLTAIKPETLSNVCRFYAPKIIPFVKEKTGFSDAEFVSVRMVSGSASVGQFLLQIYSIEDGTCGKELN